jgi:hypothetical protein
MLVLEPENFQCQGIKTGFCYVKNFIIPFAGHNRQIRCLIVNLKQKYSNATDFLILYIADPGGKLYKGQIYHGAEAKN